MENTEDFVTISPLLQACSIRERLEGKHYRNRL